MKVSIAPLTTHAWAASQRFTMTLKLKTQRYKSKWKGEKGEGVKLHTYFFNQFTIHLKRYSIELTILIIKTKSHNHIK